VELDPMPFVNIKITRDGITRAQKAQVVREVTDTLVRVLGKQEEHINIVIDIVEDQDWGFAGGLSDEPAAGA
jgi:4-oxalocrotonate tautomerase